METRYVRNQIDAELALSKLDFGDDLEVVIVEAIDGGVESASKLYEILEAIDNDGNCKLGVRFLAEVEAVAKLGKVMERMWALAHPLLEGITAAADEVEARAEAFLKEAGRTLDHVIGEVVTTAEKERDEIYRCKEEVENKGVDEAEEEEAAWFLLEEPKLFDGVIRRGEAAATKVSVAARQLLQNAEEAGKRLRQRASAVVEAALMARETPAAPVRPADLARLSEALRGLTDVDWVKSELANCSIGGDDGYCSDVATAMVQDLQQQLERLRSACDRYPEDVALQASFLRGMLDSMDNLWGTPIIIE